MNHESEQTRRTRENRRGAMIMLLLVLLAAGIHCWHHRQLYFGKAGAEPVTRNTAETVVCSWYGAAYHGRTTANGETYDMNTLTFAHCTLPFGTLVRFSYNGKSVVGRCNDRGPFIPGRTFDLSKAMAESLGILAKGVDAVQVEVLE